MSRKTEKQTLQFFAKMDCVVCKASSGTMPLLRGSDMYEAYASLMEGQPDQLGVCQIHARALRNFARKSGQLATKRAEHEKESLVLARYRGDILQRHQRTIDRGLKRSLTECVVCEKRKGRKFSPEYNIVLQSLKIIPDASKEAPYLCYPCGRILRREKGQQAKIELLRRKLNALDAIVEEKAGKLRKIVCENYPQGLTLQSTSVEPAHVNDCPIEEVFERRPQCENNTGGHKPTPCSNGITTKHNQSKDDVPPNVSSDVEAKTCEKENIPKGTVAATGIKSETAPGVRARKTTEGSQVQVRGDEQPVGSLGGVAPKKSQKPSSGAEVLENNLQSGSGRRVPLTIDEIREKYFEFDGTSYTLKDIEQLMHFNPGSTVDLDLGRHRARDKRPPTAEGTLSSASIPDDGFSDQASPFLPPSRLTLCADCGVRDIEKPKFVRNGDVLCQLCSLRKYGENFRDPNSQALVFVGQAARGDGGRDVTFLKDEELIDGILKNIGIPQSNIMKIRCGEHLDPRARIKEIVQGPLLDSLTRWDGLTPLTLYVFATGEALIGPDGVPFLILKRDKDAFISLSGQMLQDILSPVKAYLGVVCLGFCRAEQFEIDSAVLVPRNFQCFYRMNSAARGQKAYNFQEMSSFFYSCMDKALGILLGPLECPLLAENCPSCTAFRNVCCMTGFVTWPEVFKVAKAHVIRKTQFLNNMKKEDGERNLVEVQNPIDEALPCKEDLPPISPHLPLITVCLEDGPEVDCARIPLSAMLKTDDISAKNILTDIWDEVVGAVNYETFSIMEDDDDYGPVERTGRELFDKLKKLHGHGVKVVIQKTQLVQEGGCYTKVLRVDLNHVEEVVQGLKQGLGESIRSLQTPHCQRKRVWIIKNSAEIRHLCAHYKSSPSDSVGRELLETLHNMFRSASEALYVRICACDKFAVLKSFAQ